MSWRRSRNPVGDFNTRGQDKCPHCGDYKPSAWARSHVATCDKNPNRATDDNEDDAPTQEEP